MWPEAKIKEISRWVTQVQHPPLKEYDTARMRKVVREVMQIFGASDEALAGVNRAVDGTAKYTPEDVSGAVVALLANEGPLEAVVPQRGPPSMKATEVMLRMLAPYYPRKAVWDKADMRRLVIMYLNGLSLPDNARVSAALQKHITGSTFTAADVRNLCLQVYAEATDAKPKVYVLDELAGALPPPAVLAKVEKVDSDDEDVPPPAAPVAGEEEAETFIELYNSQAMVKLAGKRGDTDWIGLAVLDVPSLKDVTAQYAFIALYCADRFNSWSNSKVSAFEPTWEWLSTASKKVATALKGVSGREFVVNYLLLGTTNFMQVYRGAFFHEKILADLKSAGKDESWMEAQRYLMRVATRGRVDGEIAFIVLYHGDKFSAWAPNVKPPNLSSPSEYQKSFNRAKNKFKGKFVEPRRKLVQGVLVGSALRF